MRIIIIIIILHFMVIQHSIPIPLMPVSLLKKQRHMMNEMLTGWDKGLCSIGVFQMSHVKIEDMHDAPTTSYRKPCRKTIKFVLLFILKGFKGPKDSSIRRTVLPQDSWPCDAPCQVLPAPVYLQKTLSLGISFMSIVEQQIIALHSLTLCVISPCVYMNSWMAQCFLLSAYHTWLQLLAGLWYKTSVDSWDVQACGKDQGGPDTMKMPLLSQIRLDSLKHRQWPKEPESYAFSWILHFMFFRGSVICSSFLPLFGISVTRINISKYKRRSLDCLLILRFLFLSYSRLPFLFKNSSFYLAQNKGSCSVFNIILWS